jgi:hypothetical protein
MKPDPNTKRRERLEKARAKAAAERKRRKAERPDALTPQEELFCGIYVTQYPAHNGAEAARQAGYSAHSAKAAANSLLK